MKIVAAIASTFITTALMSACSTTYQEAKNHVDETSSQIVQAERSKPAVITEPGYYINTREIALPSSNPTWLNKKAIIRAKDIPFNVLLNQLLRHYPVSVNFDKSIKPQRLTSLNYQGSMKGALDTLAATNNYVYTTQKNQINWSSFETRTFDISFMPGTSRYLVGENQSQTRHSSFDSNTLVSQIDDQQYSNLKAELSVWHDLRRTIDQLKSGEGKVVVSEATTSVTAYDHPANIKAIAQYIDSLNRRLSQQVAIKVQVLEVRLDKDFNYGIDWNLLANALGTQFSITGNAGSSTNLVADSTVSSGSTSALTRLGIGTNGTEVFINALSQQGKVRVVTEPEVVTMNNQVAAIRITQSTGYIESVSQTNNEFSSTNSINPGNITDGFTLYVLPKIQKSDVFMQISSTISNLERLEKVSTNPNPGDNTSDTEYQAIQVPTLAQKSFNQRSLVESGKTLIIAGYKRLEDAAADASFFGIKPLGGRGASSRNVETLVLITPTILHSSQHHVSTYPK